MGQVENCAGFMLLKHGFDNGSQTTTQKGRAGALIVCNHNSGSNLKGKTQCLNGNMVWIFFFKWVNISSVYYSDESKRNFL